MDIIIYQIYQLVGGFPARFVSSRISQNIFFHFIFLEGASPKLVFTFNVIDMYLHHVCSVRRKIDYIPIQYGELGEHGK